MEVVGSRLLGHLAEGAVRANHDGRRGSRAAGPCSSAATTPATRPSSRRKSTKPMPLERRHVGLALRGSGRGRRRRPCGRRRTRGPRRLSCGDPSARRTNGRSSTSPFGLTTATPLARQEMARSTAPSSPSSRRRRTLPKQTASPHDLVAREVLLVEHERLLARRGPGRSPRWPRRGPPPTTTTSNCIRPRLGPRGARGKSGALRAARGDRPARARPARGAQPSTWEAPQ